MCLDSAWEGLDHWTSHVGVSKIGVFPQKMDGLYLSWKTLLKWMIWGENPLFSETSHVDLQKFLPSLFWVYCKYPHFWIFKFNQWVFLPRRWAILGGSLEGPTKEVLIMSINKIDPVNQSPKSPKIGEFDVQIDVNLLLLLLLFTMVYYPTGRNPVWMMKDPRHWRSCPRSETRQLISVYFYPFLINDKLGLFGRVSICSLKEYYEGLLIDNEKGYQEYLITNSFNEY